jgi:hypothetical protein
MSKDVSQVANFKVNFFTVFIYILLFLNLSFLYKPFNYRLSIIYIDYEGFNIGNVDFFIDRHKYL